MRNLMIFVAMVFVAIFAYKIGTPYLEEMGYDMNLTASDDTNVEKTE